jgi:hypothetical protein
MEYSGGANSMKSHDKLADVSAAVLQLWELKDNIIAAHEISDQVIRDSVSSNPNMLRATAILRMTTSWIVITLWKIHELWQRYAYLASDETRRVMGRLDKEILERNIKQVRNTIAAHLLDNDTKNPVPPSAVFAQLLDTWKGDPRDFFVWLVGTGPGTYSVQGCLAEFLNELSSKHPGALRDMMLAEQKKMVGYPPELPTGIDKDGNFIRK